jgi:hypothetical protein
MVSKINLEVVRGDSRRLIFVAKDPKGKPANIFGWKNFVMTVSSIENPVDSTTVVATVDGDLETNGFDGKIRFLPDSMLEPGTYYFDIQCLDNENNTTTMVRGKYTVTQDITK